MGTESIRKTDGQSSAAPGDWVKDLFAPIFDFDAIIAAGKHDSRLDKPYIKRASILDPQTVKEVFERVHQRVIESERLKLEELAEKKREKCKIRLVDKFFKICCNNIKCSF